MEPPVAPTWLEMALVLAAILRWFGCHLRTPQVVVLARIRNAPFACTKSGRSFALRLVAKM